MTAPNRTRYARRTALPHGRDAFDKFVTNAKLRQPYQNITWDAVGWNILASSMERAHSRPRREEVLYFTRSAGWWTPSVEREAFTAAFADLVKACIVMRRADRGVGNAVQKAFVSAARSVYDALPLAVRRDPSLLNRSHFVRAEELVQQTGTAASHYKGALYIEELSRIVDRHGISRVPIDFRTSLREPPRQERSLGPAKENGKGLPSAEALHALAAIANDSRLAESDFDLLRMRCTEVLLVAGFRVGEVLTLPDSPLVRESIVDEAGVARCDAETGEPMERVGIRYWPEKGGAIAVKWVWTDANKLVLRAVSDIERICNAARTNARWLEKHPGRINIRVQARRQYNIDEVDAIVGRKPTGTWKWIKDRGRGGIAAMTTMVGRRRVITGAKLVQALAGDRYDEPMLVRIDGRSQQLSSSLIVIFADMASCQAFTRQAISQPLSYDQIAAFLCGRARARSIFERYDVRDNRGKLFTIKTHSFRRLVNTVANRGGLSQLEIAEWMGRSSTRDNRSYDFRTAGELADDLRPLIGKGTVYGALVDQVNALPASERSSFLESRLAMTHGTAYGECTSNVVEAPCEVALSCLSGCTYYVRRRGDESSRRRLLGLERQTVIALERARTARDEGKHNAENWVTAQETILRNIKMALAIDEDGDAHKGEWVAVNPGGDVIGRPL